MRSIVACAFHGPDPADLTLPGHQPRVRAPVCARAPEGACLNDLRWASVYFAGYTRLFDGRETTSALTRGPGHC